MASNVLNLFPARIAFVNADGTLTAEAYRALQTLTIRVGGPLGDNGVDVFADISGVSTVSSSVTDTTLQQQSVDVLQSDILQQQNIDTLQADIIQQQIAFDQFFPDTTQPFMPLPAVASGGAAPLGGTGTAAGGWSTAVDRDSAITLLNKIRIALIAAGIMT
jgi:hypothetical protein